MYRSGRAGCLSAVITRIVAFTLPVGVQKKAGLIFLAGDG